MSLLRSNREVRMSVASCSVHVNLVHYRTLLWGMFAALLRPFFLFYGNRTAQNFLNQPLSICSDTLFDDGPGSSVGIATDYGLGGPGSNPGGDEIFRPSRPALGPTQPPVKWVPGLSRGVKFGRGVLLTAHPLLVPRSWKSRAIPLPTLWATPGL